MEVRRNLDEIKVENAQESLQKMNEVLDRQSRCRTRYRRPQCRRRALCRKCGCFAGRWRQSRSRSHRLRQSQSQKRRIYRIWQTVCLNFKTINKGRLKNLSDGLLFFKY